jgi:hypothetical protein
VDGGKDLVNLSNTFKSLICDIGENRSQDGVSHS